MTAVAGLAEVDGDAVGFGVGVGLWLGDGDDAAVAATQVGVAPRMI